MRISAKKYNSLMRRYDAERWQQRKAPAPPVIFGRSRGSCRWPGSAHPASWRREPARQGLLLPSGAMTARQGWRRWRFE